MGKSLLVLLAVMVVLVGFICVKAQNTASINGKVISNDTSIVVQVIQNLSIVSQTNISEDGSYSFFNLPADRYGLLFIKDSLVYIYHGEANQLDWIKNNEVQVDKIEFIELSDGTNFITDDMNFVIGSDAGMASVITLHFSSNVSEEERLAVISSYNLSIIDVWAPSFIDEVIYTVRIPDDKTILEMIRTIYSSGLLNAVYPYTFAHLAGGSVKEANITEVERNQTLPYVDPEILKAFENNQTWVSVGVKYKGDIPVTFENEEEMVSYYFNSSVAKSFFGYIPEIEMKNIQGGLQALQPFFTAEVKKEGLDKLIENERVTKIYMDMPVYSFGNESHKEENNLTQNQTENQTGIKTSETAKPKSFFQKIISFLKSLFKRNFAECYRDSDCVKVQTTCCPCNSGGEEACVIKSNASYYQNKLKECPSGFGCREWFNCHIKSCSCIKGKCEEVPLG